MICFMKKYVSCFKITLISLLFLVSHSIQTKAGDDDQQGIKFRHITFEQALAALPIPLRYRLNSDSS
jgi:hypothetical protein